MDGIVIVNIDEGTMTVNASDIVIPSIPAGPAAKFSGACLAAKRRHDVTPYVSLSATSADAAAQAAANRNRAFNREVVSAAVAFMVDLFR